MVGKLFVEEGVIKTLKGNQIDDMIGWNCYIFKFKENI